MILQPRILNIFLGALLLALGGCKQQPHREYSADELVGRWELQVESFKSVESRLGRMPKNSHLNINSDGSASVQEMPIEGIGEGADRFRFKSGSGTWSYPSPRRGDLQFTLDDGLYTFAVETEGQSAVLVDFVYEPDSGERWVWKKAPSPR